MKQIQNIPENGKKRVVIVGAGFAGLKLARKLAKADFQVVVIDKNNFHQFQPLFYQVATSGLEPASITFPLRKIFQKKDNVHFRLAELLEVDPVLNTIMTTIGSLHYDQLVLATGVTTNYFGNKTIEKYSISMKSVSEAIFLRNSILRNFEKALNETDQAKVSNFMNIVIVGGGPTGVELAGALAEMKNYILPKDYPELDFSRMKVFLFEGAPRLLNGMSKKASDESMKFLKKLGVIVKTNALVTEYDGSKMVSSDGKTYYSNTLIWAAGVVAPPTRGLHNIETGPGQRLKVDAYNRLINYENIFVIGDYCYQTDSNYPKGHPQVAQVAIQQASLLGENLSRLRRKQSMRSFHYQDKGSLATIGRNLAVADLGKIHFSGFWAWLLWLFVHLMAIVGVKNRFFIFINWVWNYLTYDQSLRVFIRPHHRSFTDILKREAHEKEMN